MALYTEYTWVFVVAIIFAFIAAFGVGANDVANSFSTSVGAKSITIKQAIFIACIFEFSGAFFMGKHVTNTIRKGIADIDLFMDEPDIFMFGMMCVCISNAGWLLFATYLKLPVSTTHTCVGGIMGFVIACKGWDGVEWSVVGKIIISWFLSPIASGIFAVILASIIKCFIMHSSSPSTRALLCYPLLVWFTFFIVIFYTIYKGTPQLGLSDTHVGVAIGISIGISIFFAIIAKLLAVPRLKSNLEQLDNDKIEMANKNKSSSGDIEEDEVTDMWEEDTHSKRKSKTSSSLSDDDDNNKKNSSFMDRVIPDVEQTHKNEASNDLLDMLDKTEKFDEKAEYVFTHLQVITACFASFAHGANDVSNSIGPLAAVVSVYQTMEVDKKADVPLWILALGGIGIVLGLVLYGYKIMQVIGFELTKLSPSRGFSIELGGAMVIITGSRLELPLSTTHCQVGATIGVGLMQGCSNVNWSIIPRVIMGWIMTVIISAFGTGILFAFAAYSPRI